MVTFRSLIKTVYDSTQRNAVYRLIRFKTEDPVQLKVQEELMVLLERFRMLLRPATLSNQRTIEGVNTLPVDVNKLLEQHNTLPNHPIQGSHYNTSKTTTKNKHNRVTPLQPRHFKS